MDSFNTQDNIILKMLNRRWKWHAAFWLVYLSVTLPGEIRMVFSIPDLSSNTEIPFTTIDFALTVFIYDLNIFIYTYLIIFWIYPQFFKPRRYLLFLFWGILTALALNFFTVSTAYNISPEMNQNDWLGAYLSGLTTFALFLFLVTMLKFFKDSLIQQQRDNQLFKEAKQAELDNLKAQLSPHFLFNTMNNFYGLAVARSEQLPDLMLRLSELMRYSLYGTNRKTVPLKDEIRYLKNYIELEKIRLEASLKLVFQDDTNENQNIEIVPLILIVFVENAFKHSRSSQDKPIEITIAIGLENTNWLVFSIENNYALKEKNQEELFIKNKRISTENNTNSIAGGIGLENVKKRLQALYPGNLHNLILNDDGSSFKVNLKIKLR
jgi:sensor histidine kinase YesM